MKTSFQKLKTKFRFRYSKRLKKIVANLFWFFTGAFLSLIFLTSLILFVYQKIYDNKVYPGIYVGNKDFGGQTKEYVKNYYKAKNNQISESSFVFTSDYGIATISAKQIGFGYEPDLLAEQAYSLGKSTNLLSNISVIVQAYFTGIHLSPTYAFSRDVLAENLKPIKEKIDKKPVDAQFAFKNGRVTTFKPSSNGQVLEIDKIFKLVEEKTPTVISSAKTETITIPLPITVLFPNITTEEANNMGIKELIGKGESTFFHSIPGRVYNVNLASSRLDGVLIAPGEVFSFNKALGDVSAFTGYKQAYIIQNGRTVLGDGGGVCQVSTTFFRAILDAGLPIVERQAHAYRVGYYEQDSPPGIDATIFVPSVDLKFKNDTGHYILVQREIDLANYSLKFYLYGTSDGRKTEIGKPVILSQSPPPEPLYQDDPNLPVGQVSQTDFAAWGANVYFTRTVTRDGKVIISDKFTSNYRPWQAVFLRGTKQ
ncbi:MAG: VanW family protein [Candidatus Levybacteria bacterium]|nr:VanW family protein [Candidatus Levybacteria bacterium]